MDELARAWLAATGRRRAVLPVRLPGGLARAVRAGGLTPLRSTRTAGSASRTTWPPDPIGPR